MTTEFTWRYVFAAETVVVIGILLVRRQIAQAPAPERRPRLDWVGVALSSVGLGLIVFAILRSSVWGFVQPRTPPTIDGTEITPLGFSPVPFLVLGGLALLAAFATWESRRARLGLDQLLDTTLLRVAQLRAGLSSLLGQQFVLMGTFFVIPVYLQVVVGLDAFETGKRLLPLSLAMLIFALLGPRMAARRSPRTVAQLGLVAVSIGAVVMLASLDVTLNDPGFKIAMALIGAGAGLLASQLGNVIMSSVPPQSTSEGGGLQGTAQNLGSSLGTAVIGAVLLASLATGFAERIADNPALPAEARETIVATAEEGIDIVPVADVEQAAVEGGLDRGRGRRCRGRLRGCATRRAAAGAGRGRARCAALAVVHAPAAYERARGARDRSRGNLTIGAMCESGPGRETRPAHHERNTMFDITQTNVAVRNLLEVTGNPRHRFLLESYDRHRNLEMAGRYKEIFAPEMTVDEPFYRFNYLGKIFSLDGREQVEGIYRHWTETDQTTFYVEDEQLAVGDTMVASRATAYQQVSGAELAAEGVEADASAMYLAKSLTAMIWPYDDRCRMIGEDVWEFEPSVREFIKLAPEDVLTSEQAGELLEPLIKPLPDFDQAVMAVA